MRPLIIVTPLWDDDRQSIWMLPGYLDGLRQAGADAIIADLNADSEYLYHIASLANGLLLTGGHDISPTLYGETPHSTCGTPCPLRDSLESRLLAFADSHDMPTLGICRGFQFMNAFFGGTLYQDLPTEHSHYIDHHVSATMPRDTPAHSVIIESDSTLRDIVGTERLEVNSYHHQGVRTVGTGLHAVAVAPDGLVEAVERTGRSFMLGIQWHPEFMPRDDKEQSIFRSFAAAAAQHRASATRG